jgi:hypothetical protein
MIPILSERPRLWRALQAIPEVTHNRATEFKLRHGYIAVGLVAGIALGAAGAGLVASCFWTGAYLPWGVAGLGFGLTAVSWLLVVRQLASLRVLIAPQGFAILTLGAGNACRCYRIEESLAAWVTQPSSEPSAASAPEQPAPVAVVAAGSSTSRITPTPSAYPESCNPSRRGAPGERCAPAAGARRPPDSDPRRIAPGPSSPGPRQQKGA